MFFRRVGHKVLLLRSYRDGEGRVQQRRLAHFDTVEQMRAALAGGGWDEWRGAVQSVSDDARANWDELRNKAQRLADSAAALESTNPRSAAARPRAEDKDSSQKVLMTRALGLIRSLARCLAQIEAGAERERLAAELADLREQCLQRPVVSLPQAEALVREGRLQEARVGLERLVRESARTLRRRSFVPGEAAGAQRLRGLELLAEVLQQSNDREGAASVWGERVRCSGDSEAVARYGECLHAMGRLDEAARQYRRLPKKDARRHFHLAALHWDSGNAKEAIEALLCGLVRDRNVAEQLTMLQKGRAPQGYWQLHASLWSSSGRRFFANVYKQAAVRWTLTQAAKKGSRPRRLLPSRTVGLLLEKALAASRS